MWELLGSNSLLGTSRVGWEPGLAWTPAPVSGFRGTCFFPVGTCFTGQLTSWTGWRKNRRWPSFKRQKVWINVRTSRGEIPHTHTPSAFCDTLWPAAPPETQSSAHSHCPEMASLRQKTQTTDFLNQWNQQAWRQRTAAEKQNTDQLYGRSR